jgi:hypothetical protein
VFQLGSCDFLRLIEQFSSAAWKISCSGMRLQKNKAGGAASALALARFISSILDRRLALGGIPRLMLEAPRRERGSLVVRHLPV